MIEKLSTQELIKEIEKLIDCPPLEIDKKIEELKERSGAKITRIKQQLKILVDKKKKKGKRRKDDC